MPTWAKVLLSILAVIILLCLAGGFMAYRWFNSNKDAMLNVQKEGAAFGQGKDFEQCTTAALARVGPGIMSNVQARIFADGCYKSATKLDASCEGVPAKTEIMKNAQWNVEQCRKRGAANDQGCVQLMPALAEACRR